MVELVEKYYKINKETVVYSFENIKVTFTIKEGGIISRVEGGNAYPIDPDETSVEVEVNGKPFEIKYDYDFKCDLIECLEVKYDNTLYFTDDINWILKTWIKDEK